MSQPVKPLNIGDFVAFLVRNAKRSCLFNSSRRKSFQFRGSLWLSESRYHASLLRTVNAGSKLCFPANDVNLSGTWKATGDWSGLKKMSAYLAVESR